MNLRELVESLAAETGCERRLNVMGNPMHTMTTTELIQFALQVLDNRVKLAALLNKEW
jgi:hypothetical protein